MNLALELNLGFSTVVLVSYKAAVTLCVFVSAKNEDTGNPSLALVALELITK